VHGVLVVPSLNRVYAAATGNDQAVTFDATSLNELARSATGRSPDGLAYDPDTNAMYLSNQAGTTVIEIDASTGATRGDIDIGSEAGNVAYDAISKRILVDAQSRNDIAAIDPLARRVVERHPVPGCDHDHGLQIDADHRRAFVACDGNAKLFALDLGTVAVHATFPTGADPDVLTLHAEANRLYVLATIIDTSTEPATTRRRDSWPITRTPAPTTPQVTSSTCRSPTRAVTPYHASSPRPEAHADQWATRSPPLTSARPPPTPALRRRLGRIQEFIQQRSADTAAYKHR
jgi:DNA-binding beta-propeller fold protein YncE